MSDLIVDVAATQTKATKRELQLHAIRVLAKHDALDLVPMLFAPMGPTYDHDAWRRKQRKGEA
jgi:hypothetical protein